MKEISKAIIAVMKDVKNIEKTKTVGTGTSSYKAITDSMVRSEVKQSMMDNGLIIIPTEVSATTQTDRWEEESQYGKKSKQSVFTQAHTKYKLIHTSGESLELSGYGQGVDSQDKGAGKATTYALKNVLLDLFLIVKGDDMDVDSTHSNDIEVPKPKPKPPTPEEATNTALDKINKATSITELMELDQKIKDSKYIPEDKKIDLSFELQAKILTFDPTID